MLHLKHSSSITQSYYYLPKSEQRLRVPKNGVWRSKRLLKHQLLPHQHWSLELRTSLTKAGDGAKCGAKFAATLRVISLEVTQPWGGQRRLQCLVDGLSPACWSEDHPRI